MIHGLFVARVGDSMWASYNDRSPPGTVTLNGGEK